jgi:hypothetical protein
MSETFHRLSTQRRILGKCAVAGEFSIVISAEAQSSSASGAERCLTKRWERVDMHVESIGWM